MKFLLVEADQELVKIFKKLLVDHHYLVDVATHGQMAELMAANFPYDLILLGQMLSRPNHIQLCQNLRAAGVHTPIVLMVAQDASTDRVASLNAGADDCLIKPFEPAELLARIRAVLRRTAGFALPILQWGGLCLDPSSGKVTYSDRYIALTPKEYGLLELFLRNPHRIFSVNDLLDKLWSFEEAPHHNAVRTQIKGLRQKLRQAGLMDLIETVYGLGYRLITPETLQPAETDALRPPDQAMPDKIQGLDLATLWQPVKETYRQRVANLANILMGLKSPAIEPAVRQQVIDEVHALSGSLGSFGFPMVSKQCQAIEQILYSSPSPNAQQLHQLRVLILQIYQTLAYAAPRLKPLLSSDRTCLPQGYPTHLLVIQLQTDEDWRLPLPPPTADLGLTIQTVRDMAEAKQAIAQQRPDIVLLSLASLQPSRSQDNSPELKLLAELQSMMPPIPVLVVSPPVDFEMRVQVSQLGAAGLLQMPVSSAEVMEAINLVLHKGTPPTAKLLIVDDDPEMLTLLQQVLQPWGFWLQLLNDPQFFWETLEQTVPDLIILDIAMPKLNGFDLCQALRSAPRWREIPVLFSSAHTDAATIQQVFAIGANDYIRKPIVAPELIARLLSWLERSRLQRLQASIDHLTGVANRHRSTQDLTRLMGLADRQGQPLCFALIHFDDFEQISNNYGQALGDRILKRFGDCLKVAFREEDVVARWGEDVFVIGLYGASRIEGSQRLWQFLQTWQQMQLTQGNQPVPLTLRMGIVAYPDDASDLQGLYRAADKALFQAKAASQTQVLPKRQRLCSP